MSATNPSQEVFLKDVATHEMKVLLDNGVYRHLRFEGPRNNISWFEIITWPGTLAYHGDMGTFVFSRLPDMFQFFRTDFADGQLRINRSYWGEKLQAVDRDGRKSSHRRFSEDKLKAHVEEIVVEWVKDSPEEYDSDEEDIARIRKEFEEALREAIDDQLCMDTHGEEEARISLRDFSFEYEHPAKTKPSKYEFSDTWEWDLEDYTYRFTWCCYALAWAITKYDTWKERQAIPVVLEPHQRVVSGVVVSEVPRG